jgi:hypothetical protein
MRPFIKNVSNMYICHIHKIAWSSAFAGGILFSNEDRYYTIGILHAASGAFAGLWVGYTSPVWLPIAGVSGLSYAAVSAYRNSTIRKE